MRARLCVSVCALVGWVMQIWKVKSIFQKAYKSNSQTLPTFKTSRQPISFLEKSIWALRLSLSLCLSQTRNQASKQALRDPCTTLQSAQLLSISLRNEPHNSDSVAMRFLVKIEFILIAFILIQYVMGGRKSYKSIVSRCLYFIFLLVTNNFTDIPRANA